MDPRYSAKIRRHLKARMKTFRSLGSVIGPSWMRFLPIPRASTQQQQAGITCCNSSLVAGGAAAFYAFDAGSLRPWWSLAWRWSSLVCVISRHLITSLFDTRLKNYWPWRMNRSFESFLLLVMAAVNIALAWKDGRIKPKIKKIFVGARQCWFSNWKTKWKNVNYRCDRHWTRSWHLPKKKAIDLTIVGPKHRWLSVLSTRWERRVGTNLCPNAAAAQKLEAQKPSPKTFFSTFTTIPTAAYGTFMEVAPAVAYIKQQGAPIVVKADGA